VSEPRRLDLGMGGEADPAVVAAAAAHLQGGGLVAIPTETVYGFSCLPEEEPLAALRRMKRRDPDRPFLLLVSGFDAVRGLDWSQEARELARVFWPGALTLILADREARFPPGIRGPEGGVAVRVSPHPLARSLLELLRAPLVSTSANHGGGPPAMTGMEAFQVGQSLGAGDELWVLDGGALPPSDPSTVVDCVGTSPRVVRSGALPVHRIRCVLPGIQEPNPDSRAEP